MVWIVVIVIICLLGRWLLTAIELSEEAKKRQSPPRYVNRRGHDTTEKVEWAKDLVARMDAEREKRQGK